MVYQALYRKYRPRRFSDVVGQSHITVILKNQIQAARAAHAYLFCGSRGTGKTSTAKIFARAVNCLAPVDGEACGICEACLSMDSETVDIIEIDAASNNGVDDVRALIEQSRFTPLNLKYKVYIIDEVHMLSSAASNALLKTLEEPPTHVLFLLATTEPQKLLATVISRCQRYDFKRLGVADIVATLKSVLLQVGAFVDEEGLLTIARSADGGLRDALSLMDQCLAFCGENVSAKDVYDVLGSMDADFLFTMTDALFKSEAASSLRLLDEIIRGGRDLMVFSQDLAQHMRAVLLAKECGDCRDLLDCTEETMSRLQEQAKIASAQRLLRALELLTKAQNEMKWLGRPRILLETTLVSICRPEDEDTLSALMDRVERLEAALANGTAVQQTIKDEAPPKIKHAPKSESEAKKPEVPKKAAPDSAAAEDIWKKLLGKIKEEDGALYSAACLKKEVKLNEGVLTLLFPETFSHICPMFEGSRALIEKILSEIAPGTRFKVSIAGKAEPDDEIASLSKTFKNLVVE